MVLLPANVADHLAAVTVFANPSSRFGRPLTDWSPVYTHVDNDWPVVSL
jgi:hypothetical protein